MHWQPVVDTETGETYIPVAERGRALLEEPLLNKGSAFDAEERETLALRGLLPAHIGSMEEQLLRVREQLDGKPNAMQRHIYLAGLQDRSETLFYRFLVENLTETVPIIYTPTVAEACRHWSRIFRRPRGVYITPDDRGNIERIMRHRGLSDTAVIVITDGERILGIGDQGAGGMGIPIGKLALYTVGAGIHPSLCLPICLDVGTDNEELLEDPLYLGVRAPRLRGDAYWQLVDEVVHAVRRVCPSALLQWEDFANRTSFRNLETYRDVLPSFNDDIDGTAAMVVGGLYAALRRTGERLIDQRVVITGAGSAGIGIGSLIIEAMRDEGATEAECHAKVLMTDSRGLLFAGRDGVTERKAVFAAPAEMAARLSPDGESVPLLDLIVGFEPTVLIGVTGRPGTFTEPMIGAMSGTTDHPIVMPLSNPTAMAEAIPADILAWSRGKALVATGSPFDDVVLDGRRHRIGQANNVFIFPGVGLGTIVGHATRVSSRMFLGAARALADAVEDADLNAGALYPAITRVREVSRLVGLAVVAAAVADGTGSAPPDPEAAIERAMWWPQYLPYRPV